MSIKDAQIRRLTIKSTSLLQIEPCVTREAVAVLLQRFS